MKRLLLFLFVSLSGTFLAAQNFEMKPGQRLSEIRDAVRVWHQANPGKTATVKIASGDYYLDEAVFLGPEDSFTVYEAKDPAAKPNFTRGIEITGWRIAENGWFVTNIESVKNGDWWFECLFVNGKRAVHARTPNADAPEGRRYFYLLNVDEANPSTRFAQRLEQKALFAEIAALPNPEDVKMMCYHSWESSLHRVQSVDISENLVNTESVQKLQTAIKTLPLLHQEIIRLKFEDEQTNVQIADSLGMNASTVGTILNRSMKKLRKILEEYYHD